MKSAYIFFNPKSGKDEQALAKEVKSYLIEHDFQDDYVRIITPSSVEEAVALAKKASEDHIDLVIPLGEMALLIKSVVVSTLVVLILLSD